MARSTPDAVCGPWPTMRAGPLAALGAALLALGLGSVPARGDCSYDWLPGDGIRGLNGTAQAAIVFDDGTGPAVHAGGTFTVAGTTLANRIARWNPAAQNWSTLGSGLNGAVRALAVLDGKLYAGGEFTTAGGITANYIACWDPGTQTWSALGSGMSGGGTPFVRALAALGGKLYAGGRFTTAGGVEASRIACWDPATQTWSALGSGVTDGLYYPVYALAVLDGVLHAGGSFVTVDGAVSAYWARWGLTGTSEVDADLDADCDVDGADLVLFGDCRSGPRVPHDGTSLCQGADLDDDDDVDQADFGLFQRCRSGAGRLADPLCLDD